MCPKRFLSFNYFEIVEDAFRLAQSCIKANDVGELYFMTLRSLKKSTLTGFVILAVPLVFGDPWNTRHLLENTSKEDVIKFIEALKTMNLSHFKKIIAKNYPTFEKALNYSNLYDLFLGLSKYDSLFREIVSNYPNVLTSMQFICECGINEACFREVQRILLANVIDELIVRKHGFEVMSRLREMARSNVHHIYIKEMELNPGSTADIIATSIYLLLRQLHDKV